MCVGDMVDRILFQRQLRDSLHVTFFPEMRWRWSSTGEPRQSISRESRRQPTWSLRRVLTKYSTAHNNALFMANIAAQLAMDQQGMLEMFLEDGELSKEKISESDISRIRKFIADCTSTSA